MSLNEFIDAALIAAMQGLLASDAGRNPSGWLWSNKGNEERLANTAAAIASALAKKRRGAD